MKERVLILTVMENLIFPFFAPQPAIGIFCTVLIARFSVKVLDRAAMPLRLSIMTERGKLMLLSFDQLA